MAPSGYDVYIDGKKYTYGGISTTTWGEAIGHSYFNDILKVGSDGYVYSTDGTKQLFDASNNPVKSTDIPVENANYYLVIPTPPSVHKTLVGGTAYQITGGKVMVGGTAYSITKGRTLVGGTGYDLVLTQPVRKITFTVLGSYSVSGTYTAEEGMTYRDWVGSSYNTAGFYLIWGEMKQVITWPGSNNKILSVDIDRVINRDGVEDRINIVTAPPV